MYPLKTKEVVVEHLNLGFYLSRKWLELNTSKNLPKVSPMKNFFSSLKLNLKQSLIQQQNQLI